MWTFIEFPLTYLGVRLGIRQSPIQIPCQPMKLYTDIPPQPWYLNPLFTTLVGGFIPFVYFLHLYENNKKNNICRIDLYIFINLGRIFLLCVRIFICYFYCADNCIRGNFYCCVLFFTDKWRS